MPIEQSYGGRLARLDALFLRANRALLIVLLAAMALMVFANVVLRFVTSHSILWVEEVSRYTMIWLTFLGAGLVLRHGGHIGIDTLQSRLPRWAPKIRATIFLLVLGFCAFMAWIGTRYAMLTWNQTTAVLQIPVGFVYLALPAGFALVITHLLLMAAPYIRRNEFIVDAEFDPDAVKL
ncbi:MAG TPA: TRAP transporter small permease [Casimicrobiaceae bacterium]|jgi:TRAP-type C4-dicarboxylate transport system permease small subunit